MGFSGAGSLVARLAEYTPERVIASIPADPSQFDSLGMDTVNISPKAQKIPQLILTGSADHVSGTKRPYDYFRKYFDKGAPWAFVIQNKTPHCCIINAKKLVLLRLQAILEGRQLPNGALGTVDTRRGWRAFIATRETETKDTWDEKTSEASDARIRHSGSAPPDGMIPQDGCPIIESLRNGCLSSSKLSTR
ncbi:MAG TPA: hypothetical protein VJO16_13955 [Candidatus Acidoferrum sp.]|nr:hypothetical protein [Candidatus Acidoferrum sp.]